MPSDDKSESYLDERISQRTKLEKKLNSCVSTVIIIVVLLGIINFLFPPKDNWRLMVCDTMINLAECGTLTFTKDGYSSLIECQNAGNVALNVTNRKYECGKNCETKYFDYMITPSYVCKEICNVSGCY